MRVAMYGRPGPTYVELPVRFRMVQVSRFLLLTYLIDLQAEVIYDILDEDKLVLPTPIPPPPLTYAEPQSIRAALDLLRTAKNPLVIVGKVRCWYNSCQAAVFLPHFSIPRELHTLELKMKLFTSCTFSLVLIILQDFMTYRFHSCAAKGLVCLSYLLLWAKV